MNRLWRLLVSLRTTAGLIVLLSGLLLLRVTIPQAADGEAYVRAVRASAFARFVLETLGAGRIATSPIFLASLAAFFVNLLAVLVDKAGATARRLRIVPPSPAQVSALLDSPAARELPGVELPPQRVAEVLGRLGYRVVGAPGGATWGVKHALAILGFPIFHASFFFLAAGGIALYLSRDVGTLVVTEGVEADSADAAVVRRAPIGTPQASRIFLDRVDVAIVDGRPVGLKAEIQLDGARTTTEINRPAVRGPLSVLVERCGIAPVLWMTDARGFTVDRLLVPAADRAGLPTRVRLGTGDVEVAVLPISVGPDFPQRSALGGAGVSLRVFRGGRKEFEGVLRPAESIAVGELSLAVQEVRYWAGFRLVRERGGGPLVLGFALAVVGIVWRMIFFRREVIVAAVDGGTRVAGRGEFYPSRLREEVDLLAELLSDAAGEGGREEGTG